MLGWFAYLCNAQSLLEQAVCLWGAADALHMAIGAPLSPKDQEDQEQDMAAVREKLGEPAFGTAWANGHNMKMEEAIQYALSDKR